MDITTIGKELINELHRKAREVERLRMSFDLRTTAEDGSCFVESARFRVCSRERRYGIQVPLGGLV